ncbi:MAG: radical SAM/SPASM domain-containing protein [Desulfobacterales bacterium]|nr:radical SAM/SPASM domain-containing protein [Desulfobacterales bacterium]
MITSETEKPRFEYDSRVNPYFPHQVLMETTSACQLRCVMCAREQALMKGTLKVDHMEEWLAMKIIEEIAAVNPKTRFWFCFFGEPTISKQIWRRVKIAKEKKIETTIINSNGNLLTPTMCDQIIECGLDEIYVGLDAATSETYSRVRVRGNFEKVVQGVHYLLKHKGDNLKVTVQFGVYDENEHELEQFKKYWTDLGVPIFVRPKMTWLGYLSEHYHTDENRYPCPWILDSLPIYYNGLVPFCVVDWDNRMPVGDIKKQSITEVWQTSYRKWQNHHLAGKFKELPKFCRQCRDWQTKPLRGQVKNLFGEKKTFDDIHMAKPDFVKTTDFFES